jgi:methylated-DNA-[protein]-cysteine S-methyltransferase
MEYIVFNTNIGWIAIVGSERGLVSISLPLDSAQQALESLSEDVEFATSSPNRFKGLVKHLKAYCNGNKVSFKDEIDFSIATQFQKKVWQGARLIPYGETRCYQWLAEKVGKPGAARAIGQALGKNKLPIIIPCHRVISRSGDLGGFRGGLEMKRRLLNLEAAINSFEP